MMARSHKRDYVRKGDLVRRGLELKSEGRNWNSLWGLWEQELQLGLSH